MKREQAKREIDSLDYYLQNHTDDYGEESHTAMMMAIEALEQEPFMNKPCISEGVCHDSAVQMLDDAISRTRAMETFERWAEFKDYTHVERHILHAVVDELRAMPSISEQPDEWTPILKDLYDGMAEGGNHDRME